MLLIVYIAVGALCINLLFYLLFAYFGFSGSQTPATVKAYPVSLIVCAKNEAFNLRKHIPLWLAQEHPNFELVLIDDASVDQTPNIIEEFAKKDSRISPVYVKPNERFYNSKKYALTLGIKKAAHPRLVFTDADCTPASPKWLNILSQHFSQEKQLVLGYGGYLKKRSFLNLLIRFETLVTALQYFAYAKVGWAYMGVGRNLGYTSMLFHKHKGFASHIKVRSGDDDLFVNEAATKENTAICTDPAAFTYSEPKTTFKDWVKQKRRHISTAKYYKAGHKLTLGLYYLANLCFWLALSALFFLNVKTALILLTLRVVLQWIAYFGACKKLKATELILLSPLMEVFLICAQMAIFIINTVSAKPSWK